MKQFLSVPFSLAGFALICFGDLKMMLIGVFLCFASLEIQLYLNTQALFESLGVLAEALSKDFNTLESRLAERIDGLHLSP